MLWLTPSYPGIPSNSLGGPEFFLPLFLKIPSLQASSLMGGRLGSRQPHAESQAWFLLPQHDILLACGEQLNRIVSICLGCWLICSHWLTLLFSSLINFVDPFLLLFPFSLYFVCLRQSFAVSLWLCWNLLYKPGWPQTHSVSKAGIKLLSLVMPPKCQGLCM